MSDPQRSSSTSSRSGRRLRSLLGKNNCVEGKFSEVGQFRVEEVECFGQRRWEPCSHLERLTRP
jgi:hypothetical protein